LSFEEGDICHQNGRPRRTTIQFICDTSDSAVKSGLSLFSLGATNSSTCDATFLWKTPLGCPVCTDDDYDKVIGQCVNGKQNVLYSRIRDCNGPKTKDEVYTSCTISFNFPIGVVIASLIVFVALIGVALFIFVKNRQMSHKYSRLQQSFNQSTGGREEGVLELDVIEDDNKTKKFSIDE